MENNFFMPVGKLITIWDTNGRMADGNFQGFVTLGGIPSIFLVSDHDDINKREVLIPINQVVRFEVIKPKNILL
jgi:hypothetical protein